MTIHYKQDRACPIFTSSRTIIFEQVGVAVTSPRRSPCVILHSDINNTHTHTHTHTDNRRSSRDLATIYITEPQTSKSIQSLHFFYFLWLCSSTRAMTSCGSAAQRGLWPPVALQLGAGYVLLWLCSSARARASCGSAAQRGLWPSVALQPSAG
jgi:hypothetical protein